MAARIFPMTNSDMRERLIISLDVPTAIEAHKLVTAIGETAVFYKVGMQLFTAEGPGIVRDLKSTGKKVFLDLKFHDIPNTAASAVKSAAELGVDMLTVHISGGSKMLRAAVEAAASGEHKPTLLGVTVLTSMADEDLTEISVRWPAREQVLHLALLAKKCGLGGVVCSPLEIRDLRAALGPEIAIVVPGIRPTGSGNDDQVRVATPAEAMRAGANYLVLGRQTTAATDRAAAARAILQEMQGASCA